jgi:AdoMet-dependent rRNA methyltransferase SPB1
MGGTKKGKGKTRIDKYYNLAREQGYRSRASFKLVQLNKRYDFLTSASRGCLDLCAAPGGWMQIARKHMPLDAPVIGIDLVPIRPIPGCTGLVGDITTEQCRSDLRRTLKEHPGAHQDGKVDCVLNDGSPNMGQAWLQDAYTQSELTLAGVRLASDFLAPGGSFITKVFRSNDYNALLFVMNQLFRKVHATKPSASRAESAEIYVMCTGYRAPKSIDARLLNPKYVFKDMGSMPADGDDVSKSKRDLVLSTVLKGMKQRKRHREGYADGALTMYKRLSAIEFFRTSRPVAMVCEVSAFSINPKDVEHREDAAACNIIRDMLETTTEVLSCCDDLKVLGRRDFKLLLNWRIAGRTALGALGLLELDGEDGDAGADVVDSEAAAAAPAQPDVEVDPDVALDNELSAARAELEAKEKRKKRKTSKLRNALQRKIDMKIVLPNDQIDMDGENGAGLFKLSTASRAQNHGVVLSDADPSDADDGNDTEESDGGNKSVLFELKDTEEAIEENAENVAGELDHWYKVYLARTKKDKNGVLLQESKDRKRRTKRRALREAQAAAAEREGREAEGIVDDEPSVMVEANSSASSDDDGADTDSDGDFNMGKLPVNSREAALWFSQPVFAGAAVMSSDEESDAEDAGVKRRRGRRADAQGGDASSDEDGYHGGKKQRLRLSEGGGEDIHGAARREARKKAVQLAEERQEDGFEVAPLEKDISDDDDNDEKNGSGTESVVSDSSFHSSDYDTDEKAEMVAIGRRMKQSTKEATEVLDDAYNRYTFDDPLDLPRWFADPDPIYRQRQDAIVSKEQVAEMKAYIKSLEAAPSKKEAEAKARKRARNAKNLERVKTKANSIAEQADLPASSRMKAIETLYRQASRSTKKNKQRKKQYLAVQAGGTKKVVGGAKGAGGGGRKSKGSAYTVLVDKRMKTDKRGMARAEKAKKKG